MNDLIERLRAADCAGTVVPLMNKAADALEQCRKTNKRLNRRCQTYEAGLNEKIEKGRDEHRNLGRMLANAAATKYEARIEQLEAARKRWFCESCGCRRCRIAEQEQNNE